MASGKLKNRLGGHNIGMANELLDNTMKAIKAAIVEHIEIDNPDWSKKVGGEDSIKRNVFDIFDQHNTVRLVNDRSAERFVEAKSDLSRLEIAFAPELRKIFKYLSSCLHLAGVTGHPAGGSAKAFAKSTAPFYHDRPDGLEEMSDSYAKGMRRRLHIRIVLSWMGCATYPHQDQISGDSCIVLLALHAGTGGGESRSDAGTGGVGQWRITLLNPSYLGKKACTTTADKDRAGAVFSSYTLPPHSPTPSNTALLTLSTHVSAPALPTRTFT